MKYLFVNLLIFSIFSLTAQAQTESLHDVNSKREIISMKFVEHPYFKIKIKEGRIDFHTVIDGPKDKFETGADLWLIFETEQDAKAAFSLISDSLARVSDEKNTTFDNGQPTTVFKGKEPDNRSFIIKLILKKDEQGNFAIFLPANDPTV